MRDSCFQVAVMPFAERLFLHPDHCYNSQLVSASPANRLAITTFAMKAIDDSSTLNTGEVLHHPFMISDLQNFILHYTFN